MKNYLLKLQTALAKPITKNSYLSISTIAVLALVAFVASVYFGVIKFKKNAW